MAAPSQFPKLTGEGHDSRTQDNVSATLTPLARAISATPIMGAPAPSWIAPDLLNGFTNIGGAFSACGYHKDALGYVHVRGVLSHTAGTGTFTNILRLPLDYRTSGAQRFPVEGNLSTYQAVQVNADGNLQNVLAIAAGGYIGLSFSFLAEQ